MNQREWVNRGGEKGWLVRVTEDERIFGKWVRILVR
jgi:hypothetical protein